MKGIRVLARLISILFGVMVLLPAHGSADLLLSERFHSEALGRELRYSIYLPPDWRPSGEARYPVVYLLHGLGGNEWQWPKIGHVESTLDRIIAEDAIAPITVVMPAADNSWYLDMAAFGGPGDYATAISKDLRAHVEGNYPVAKDPAHRAIMGVSMGGFGALRLGFSEATEFAAIGSYGPVLFWQFDQIARITREEDTMLQREFGDEAPRHFFRDRSPYAYLRNFMDAKTKPQVFLAAGDDDPLVTAGYVIRLQDVLTAIGHHPESRVYNGGHNWSVWRRAFEDNIRLVGATLWRSGDSPPPSRGK